MSNASSRQKYQSMKTNVAVLLYIFKQHVFANNAEQDVNRVGHGGAWVGTIATSWLGKLVQNHAVFLQKGLGSRTCRIGLINRQKIKVAQWKLHSTFLCAEHFYFHEQHLFSCVNPLLLCYRLLHMGRVAIFGRFLVIFTSLIANLTRGTATLQNEILTVEISSFLTKFYGIDFVSKLCPYSRIEKFDFYHVQ